MWQFRVAFLSALGTTAVLTVVPLALGLIFGFFLALGVLSRRRILHWLAVIYVETWRSTPILVQVVWIHFALPMLTGIRTEPLTSALLALTLNISAYAAEVIRAGILGVGPGQTDAAKALALPPFVRWARVILPQALRLMVPPMTGLVLGLFKSTPIVSIIAVTELMRLVERVNAVSYRTIELYTAAALAYMLIGLAIAGLGRAAEARFAKAAR